MNRKKLFDTARASVFGGHLNDGQVDGIEALFDACSAIAVTDLRHIAYVLATPMVETGESYITISESLNYKVEALVPKFGKRITAVQAAQYGRTSSHPADQEAIANIIFGGGWGAAQLGNTKPGDGFLFRGRGLVQTTGRRLYELFGYADNPDALCDVEASADVAVRGMKAGTFTGQALKDYFNPSTTDWVNARRIVNGTDRAADIAAYAKQFYAALQGAA